MAIDVFDATGYFDKPRSAEQLEYDHQMASLQVRIGMVSFLLAFCLGLLVVCNVELGAFMSFVAGFGSFVLALLVAVTLAFIAGIVFEHGNPRPL